jgi:hypothetical protein
MSQDVVIPGKVPSPKVVEAGALILNADDWGRDRENTQRIYDCIRRGTVSSTSAMVFMEDSERAAALAREKGIDAGLHLNFTTPYTDPGCRSQILERQLRLVSYLTRHSYSRIVFHPGLVRHFEYVVRSQIDEFVRLYGAAPERIDGHHHMHLCANVLYGKLLPEGTLVRRNFSFQPGEKSLLNRTYRKAVDRSLARRHRLVDYLFPLLPLEPRARLERILSFAHRFTVEVETHPVNAEERRFLMEGGVDEWTRGFPIAGRFITPGQKAFWSVGPESEPR